jgi:pimeloyl-ACP methyl ester carboxylesterase
MSALEQTTALEIRETRISFSEAGKGEPVLMLHGNPGSRKDFFAILSESENLPCRLIMPDRPGHNGSEELLNDTNDPWLDTEVYAELIDRRCNGSAWLFGYSMGCHIASRIAMRFPDKVNGIIMAAPFLVSKKASDKPSSIPDLAKGAVLGTVFGIALPLLSQTRMQKHISNVFSPETPAQEYIDTWLPRYTRFESLIAMMQDKNAMLKTQKDVAQGFKELACPVFAIIGTKDAVCSATSQQQFIIENLPQAKIRSIADAGHAIPMTHPEECLATIREALNIS